MYMPKRNAKTAGQDFTVAADARLTRTSFQAIYLNRMKSAVNFKEKE